MKMLEELRNRDTIVLELFQNEVANTARAADHDKLQRVAALIKDRAKEEDADTSCIIHAALIAGISLGVDMMISKADEMMLLD